MGRSFAIVEKYQKADLKLPQRSTKFAAGYDFQAAEDFVVPSIWRHNVLQVIWSIWRQNRVTDEAYQGAHKDFKPVLVPTGVKVYLEDDEYLMVANRSSNPLKRGLVLPNGVGIIDADYVDNPSNEGELFIQMTNFGLRDLKIKKGERIGQGIFMKYLVTDQDAQDEKNVRQNGFGSTGV
ncbi:dUTP diphosphatase [Weissella coleopterorum]|uniref:dUTP diphosphatase n=1 Tax=Weissella coleopterorum TaxID=2714949 RepID=A0A6G8B1L6_9LACO|nr:dUTP diphosphatase [Weissella coleopterorum]QIL51127.1 dUTP diphosphatase [Weissella coleopterorum]